MMLADKLIKLRKQAGLSQEELAEKLDVSRQSVSKWESAQCAPELPKLIQLSDMYGVSLDYLLKDSIEEDEKTEAILERKSKFADARRKYFLYSVFRRAVVCALLIAAGFLMLLFQWNNKTEMTSFEDFLEEWEQDNGMPFGQHDWDEVYESYTITVKDIAKREVIKNGTILFVAAFLAGVAVLVYNFFRLYSLSGRFEEADAPTLCNGNKFGIASKILSILSAITCLAAVAPAVLSLTTDLSYESGAFSGAAIAFAGTVMFEVSRSIDVAAQTDRAKFARSELYLDFSCLYWAVVSLIYFLWNVFDYYNTLSCVVWIVAPVIFAAAFAVPQIVAAMKRVKAVQS